MKRILMVAVIILSAITDNLYAQQASKTLGLDQVKSLQNGSGYLNHLSTKAARDFAERFPEVEGKWFAAKNGFVVRFILDSIGCRAAYDTKGNWVYTIRTYDEWKLPKQVRHLVKGTYYDYTITQVEEIDRPNEHKVYLVHMYDATTWKNVQVRDGEMVLVEEFKKGRP
jgi:hypothetical protein